MTPDRYLVTLRQVVWAIAIAIASIVWTIIVPGLVAATDVFYAEQIKERLPLNVKRSVLQFDSVQAARSRDIAQLDSLLTHHAKGSGKQGNIQGIILAREQLDEVRTSAKPPAVVLPFYLNPQMILWAAIYTCLGWLLLMFNPISTIYLWKPRQLLYIAAIGLVTYIFYEWPLWLRNFVFNTHGRTVYAYPNVDVHAPSFFMQEAVILGFCLLLAALWVQWAHYLTLRRRSIAVDREEPLIAAVDARRLVDVSNTFAHWQAASAVLALGFFPFTEFFWSIVADFKDQRYILSALIAHLLWAISWIVISLPLVATWRRWNLLRIRAIAELSEAIDEQTETKLKLLQEARPFSQFVGTTSVVTVITSFVLPLLQVLGIG